MGLCLVVAAEVVPQLEIESDTKDLGKVQIGEVVRHEFVITNRGLGALMIEEKNKSCSCTAILFSNVLQSNESSVVVMESRVDYLGPVENIVQLHTNDPLRPAITLRLKFDGVRSLSVQYDENILTQLHANQSVSVPISLISHKENSTFKIITISTSANWIVPPKPETYLGKSLRMYELEFEFFPIFQGKMDENILIRTNCVEQPLIEIPFSLVVQGDYVVNPAELQLGEIIAGSTTTRTLAVSRVDGAAFTVSLVDPQEAKLFEDDSSSVEHIRSFRFEIAVPPQMSFSQFVHKDCTLAFEDASGAVTFFVLNISGRIVSN